MNLREITEKFESECEKSGDPVMRSIWNHYLPMAEAANEETLSMLSDKTLSGAIERMRAEASKHKKGNTAVLSDAEGYEIMDKYFGFDAVKKENHIGGGSSDIVSLFD